MEAPGVAESGPGADENLVSAVLRSSAAPVKAVLRSLRLPPCPASPYMKNADIDHHVRVGEGVPENVATRPGPCRWPPSARARPASRCRVAPRALSARRCSPRACGCYSPRWARGGAARGLRCRRRTSLLGQGLVDRRRSSGASGVTLLGKNATIWPFLSMTYFEKFQAGQVPRRAQERIDRRLRRAGLGHAPSRTSGT